MKIMIMKLKNIYIIDTDNHNNDGDNISNSDNNIINKNNNQNINDKDK